MFVIFIFGGFVIFLWNLYAASANFVTHEATQVPGQDPTVAIQQSYINAVTAARGSYLGGTTINLCYPKNVDAGHTTVSSDGGSLASAQYPTAVTVDGTTYPLTTCGHGGHPYDCPTMTAPSVGQREMYICVGLPCYQSGTAPNCFNTDAANVTHQDVYDIDVMVYAWLPSPVSLPVVGQQLPVYSSDDETVQGFQP